MKVTELFEAEEKDIGTLEIQGDGDELTVKCTATSGRMLSGLYWVWSEVGKKHGVKTTMMIKSRYGTAKPTVVSGNEAGGLIIDRRPTRLIFSGIDKQTLQAAVDKAIEKVHREIKADAKYKAEAPKRKAEASKYASQKRKEDMTKYTKLYGKGTWNRVTYRQEGGDDGYSYVVRVDGRAKWNGLTQREAMYYKEREVDELAKTLGIGKYASIKESESHDDEFPVAKLKDLSKHTYNGRVWTGPKEADAALEAAHDVAAADTSIWHDWLNDEGTVYEITFAATSKAEIMKIIDAIKAKLPHPPHSFWCHKRSGEIIEHRDWIAV